MRAAPSYKTSRFWFIALMAVSLVYVASMSTYLTALLIGRTSRESDSLPPTKAEERITQTKVEEPIIVVGLPKSGTTSVYQFFTCGNYTTQHFCSKNDTKPHPPCKYEPMGGCILENIVTNQSNIMQGCGEYQVYAQIDAQRPWLSMPDLNVSGFLRDDGFFDRTTRHDYFLPQHFYLEELSDFAPNATYLLPLRNSTSWAHSALNWFELRLEMWSAFKHLLTPGQAKPRSPDQWVAFLSLVYETHTKKIRRFVQTHPNHQLVEFDITNSRTASLLAENFQIDESCWGHHNRNEKAGRGSTSIRGG